MKLEMLIEMGRRVSPPDIDVDWQRTRDGSFAGEAEAWSGKVYGVIWDPKDPEMVTVKDMKTGEMFREELSYFVGYILNDEDSDEGYRY